MAPATGHDALRLELDPRDWARFKAQADGIDKQIVLRLRRRIRQAGMVAVDQVKETLGLPSPDDGPDSGEHRKALAAATKVTLSFSKKSAGAKVVTSDRLLPPEHKGLLKAYNLDKFRHPVYQTTVRRDVPWVDQRGRPYMGRKFLQNVRELALKEINEALAEAVQALENGVR